MSINTSVLPYSRTSAENEEKKLYAIQFHPEVLHTGRNKDVINFVRGVCQCSGDWRMDSFVEESIKAIREKVGDGKVLRFCSGSFTPANLL